MKRILSPLWIFITGQVILLLVLLLMPAIGDAGAQLEADTAAAASAFWGWSWASGSVKLLVFLVFEGLILFATGKAFLGLRSS